MDEADANVISLDAIKLMQSHIQLDCLTIKARMRVWRELERKLVKRIAAATKQMQTVKSSVGHD